MLNLLDPGPQLQLDIDDPFVDTLPPEAFEGFRAEELPNELPWLTFADWIDDVAGVVKSKGTPAATWLARELKQLGELARELQSITPAEFDRARAIVRQQEDNRLRDEGYSAGLDCLASDNHPLW